MTIYDEEHRIFQQSIQRHVDAEIVPYISAWEDTCFFPNSVFEKLGQEGFLGILVDEEYGGVGGDYALASAWCEEFGRVPSVGLTIAVNMHSVVISAAVNRYASEEAKKAILPDAVLGKKIGAYAFTEPNAGSDLTNVQTKAVRKGNEWVLNGNKIFITNGKRANFVLVLAKTDPAAGYDGYTTFIVDTTAPGYHVARTLSKIGWHCSDTAELVFENVHVPEQYVLGEVGKGWHQAMASLEWERLMLTLNAIGAAQHCLEDTVTYVNDRKVFGRSVGAYDLNRETIATLAAKLHAARAQAHHCVQLLNTDTNCRREVSLAKLFGCELAIEIADRCLQLHGGYGYTTEFLPERWLRDLRLNTIGGGTSEIMAYVAAKNIF